MKSTLPFFLLIIFAFHTKAQGDSTALYKKFITISSNYQSAPLQLDITIANSANIPTQPEDTITVQAKYYLTGDNAYLKFGDMEQVVGDSIGVLVNPANQRILVVEDANMLMKSIRKALNLAGSDSSVKALANQFHISTASSADALGIPANKNSKCIELNSRTKISGSQLARNTIVFCYNEKANQPVWVSTIQRRRVPVNASDSIMIRAQTGDKGIWIEEGEVSFFVLEKRTDFRFNAISHNAGEKLPVYVHDRIRKNEQSEYEGVKEYSSYNVTIN